VAPVLDKPDLTLGEIISTSADLRETHEGYKKTLVHQGTMAGINTLNIMEEEHVHASNDSATNSSSSFAHNFEKETCDKCLKYEEIIEDLSFKLQVSEMKVQVCTTELTERSYKIEWLLKECAKYEDENQLMNQKYTDCMSKLETLTSNLLNCFTSDQLQRFEDGVTRGRAYTAETITACIGMWFATGKVGYQYLLEKKFPLPSISTLHKKLALVHFPVGRAEHITDLEN
jgi:hypothetical protein